MAALVTVHLIVFLGNAVGTANAGSFHGVQFGSGVLILYVPSWGLLMALVICRIMASRFHHFLGLALAVGVEKGVLVSHVLLYRHNGIHDKNSSSTTSLMMAVFLSVCYQRF
jgi:uncharacterized ion transporter superfamily protein YfcC